MKGFGGFGGERERVLAFYVMGRKLPSLADIDEAKMSGGFCQARVYSADFA